jgi:hypothetical protein
MQSSSAEGGIVAGIPNFSIGTCLASAEAGALPIIVTMEGRSK